MNRLLSADEIIAAFVDWTAERDADGKRFVTLGTRGPRRYVRIWGPNGKINERGAPCVIVERYNGAVCFTEKRVAKKMRANQRSGKNITAHPLGASSGRAGNFGTGKWGLAPYTIASRFDSASDLVTAIVAAFGRAGVPW